MFVDVFGVCFDATYNLMAKNTYFSGGTFKVPMVFMTSTGGGYSDAGQHSLCLYGAFAHLPGMKVVCPSNAYDATGLMTAAMRDDSPVVYMYHKSVQGMGWLATEPGATTLMIGLAMSGNCGTYCANPCCKESPGKTCVFLSGAPVQRSSSGPLSRRTDIARPGTGSRLLMSVPMT